MKKILIPIDASKELPLIEKWYFVKDKNGDEEIGYFADNYFTVWGWNKKDVIAWYKEIDIDELLPDTDLIKHSCPQNLLKRISCWIQGANWVINYIKQKLES